MSVNRRSTRNEAPAAAQEFYPTWHPGDVVQLRSGGPAMTVLETKPDNTVVVVWFGLEFSQRWLPASVLMKSAPPKADIPF